MSIRVVARIIALPDQVAAFQALAMSLLEVTRQEQGCISYQLYQNLTDPTDFTFVEEWASEDDLDAHLQAPHLQAAMEKLLGLVAVMPDIRRYRLLG